MNADKIRNMTEAEMLHQQRELNDQLFRLKFQLKMGQTESLKKIRDLRKDVARLQTIEREKQLGLTHGSAVMTTQAVETAPAAAAASAPAQTRVAPRKKAGVAAKKSAGRTAKAKTKTRKK